MSHILPMAGNKTGVIPANTVGEINLGGATQRNGTGGYTFSVRSTTAFGPSPTTVLSFTLNIGNYLISYNVTAQTNQNGSSLAQSIAAEARIGGTQVEYSYGAKYTGGQVSGTVTNCFPVTITSNSTTVSLVAYAPGADAGFPTTNNFHEVWIVRIA